MLSVEEINKKDILKRAMKDKIRSLLGIEMSLGNYEFKPFLLLLGILSFILLSIPLLALYVVMYVKSTLINYINRLKKDYKNNKNIGLRGV